MNPRAPEQRRRSEWIIGIVVFLSLILTIEFLPLRWKLRMTPDYADAYMPWSLENSERQIHLTRIKDYRNLLRDMPADEDRAYSDQYGSLHRDFLESEVVSEQASYDERFDIGDALRPSYLEFLFRKVTPSPRTSP